MADYIGATPQNPLLGLLYGGYDWMRSPQRTQQMQGLAGLLESTGIPKTIERMSYGEPLTNIGQANVPLLKPETAEAMMTVAPMAGPAARGTGRLVGSQINRAMMGEGGLLAPITPQPMYAVNLPKSISGRIGNITPESKTEVKNLAETFAEEINKLGFSAKVEHSGSKAGASSYINVTDPLTGRFLSKPIRISDHSKGAKESQGVIDILNPQDDFKKITDALGEMRGMGETLVFKQNKYANELIASGVKPKTAYQRAKTEITEIQPSFQYPQEQALKLAQERAALPVEQGGLGLLAENTPEMRAKAMGFEESGYSGTSKDFLSYDQLKAGGAGSGSREGPLGAWLTDDPRVASEFANWSSRGQGGDVVYPLMIRGSNPYQPTAYSEIKDVLDANTQFSRPPYRMMQDKINYENARRDLEAKGDYVALRNTSTDAIDSPITQFLVTDPTRLRSRFAAFDPFRKDVATATAMGVALPDLLAAEYNQQPQSAGLLYPLP